MQVEKRVSQMIPSHQAIIDQGIKDSRPLYDIEEEDLKLSPRTSFNDQIKKGTGNKASTLNIKEEDFGRFDHSPLLTQPIENDLTLLPPLKAPKSYGTYSKQQQEDVIAFIKDGHSLRTAEKVFGIPKSTMHCWLKKLHVKSDLSNNMKLDNFPEPTVERGYQYNNETSYFEETESKTKSWKEKRGQRKTSPPSSPIVIEESELIRFLQSAEGIEMIGKAYSVRVSDFLDFVDSSKDNSEAGHIQQEKNNLGIYKENKYYQQVSPNTARKRNLHNTGNDYFNFDKAAYPGVAVLQKKIKVEQNTSESTENTNTETFDSKNKTYKIRKKSLGKNSNDENKKTDCNNNNIKNNQSKSNNNSKNVDSQSSSASQNAMSKDNKNQTESNLLMSLVKSSPAKKVLVPKPFLAANKMVGGAHPESGNNFVATRPLLINKVSSHNTSVRTESIQTIDQSISPPFGYHSITNPVSIKAETLDSEIGMPYNVSPNSGDGMYYVRALSPVLPTITKPVVTLNNAARNLNEIHRTQGSLNLNEINRTQSEKELMAMVDGDNLSADELCAEFKETLELNKWVDNETWYMDQYLQHFQVSPALTSPDSSLADGDSDDPDEDTNAGLTFAVKEKGKKKSTGQFEGTNKLSPVTVKIYEPNKSTGEVWSKLNSPGQPGSSPHARDGLLTSPRIYDGLLCSPTYQGGSPRERLQDAGLDPNLIQPNFTSSLINN